MISVITAVAIAIGTLMIITVVVTLMTGSLFAAGVVVALLVLLYLLLVQYGFLQVDRVGDQLEVYFKDIWATVPEPVAEVPKETTRPLRGKEVFHIGGDRFTYDDAPAVCAAYNAELATQQQVEEAHQSGAEWCGYGWSAGGLALYPTQRSTWEKLQGEIDPAKRTACGRPGVNGGYFEPTLKFGVNCYGVKPAGSAVLPAPPPGTDNAEFSKKVASFKSQIQDFFLNPFSRTDWSAYPDAGAYGTQFAQDIGKLASTGVEQTGLAFRAVGETVKSSSLGVPTTGSSTVAASASPLAAGEAAIKKAEEAQAKK